MRGIYIHIDRVFLDSRLITGRRALPTFPSTLEYDQMLCYLKDAGRNGAAVEIYNTSRMLQNPLSLLSFLTRSLPTSFPAPLNPLGQDVSFSGYLSLTRLKADQDSGGILFRTLTNVKEWKMRFVFYLSLSLSSLFIFLALPRPFRSKTNTLRFLSLPFFSLKPRIRLENTIISYAIYFILKESVVYSFKEIFFLPYLLHFWFIGLIKKNSFGTQVYIFGQNFRFKAYSLKIL